VERDLKLGTNKNNITGIKLATCIDSRCLDYNYGTNRMRIFSLAESEYKIKTIDL
jgi:hypothetical protein